MAVGVANLMNTEEKPKNVEFQLDNILPSYNPKKQGESKFIPTLKIKSKDPHFLSIKDKQKLVRGSTVLHAQTGANTAKNDMPNFSVGVMHAN